MNPPKMTMLTLALALCLAMAACRQDSGTVPTPSDTQAVAPDISDSPTAAAGQLRSTPGAETKPTLTTTPTPVSPTPTPEDAREAVAQPLPTSTPAPVSPTPTPHVIRIPAPPVRVVVKALPTPTPEWIQINGGSDYGGPCGPWDGQFHPPSSTEFGAEYSTQFLEWLPDGRHLVMSDRGRRGYMQSAISIVDTEGSEIRTIVDANPWDSLPYGFHADVSPDGSRVVYTSCEYPRCPKDTGCEEVEVDPDDPKAFNYEIATIGIDGTSPERLTRNDHYDHYPVWSPDGTRIAFLVSSKLYLPDRVQLFTMSADGSDVQALTPPPVRVSLYPPVWSPDGLWLAFVAEGGVLWTVRADGAPEPNRMKRIGPTAVVPSWSPDSERLAYADGDGIHTVRRDGTGLVQVWEKSKQYQPITMVSWSPVGSELLFVTDADMRFDPEQGVFVVGAHGGGLRRLPIPPVSGWPWPAAWAVWSPDGSKIAVYGMRQAVGGLSPSVVLSMASDGTEMRLLARVEGGRGPTADRRFHAWNPPRSEKPDLAACSQGSVVPEPESNQGLVHDCEMLLSIRDTLAGRAELNWKEGTTMSLWEGVTLGGSPPRVHELTLRGMRGELPPELGRLTELRRLAINGTRSEFIDESLTGAIPPELGSLANLYSLDLSWNFLSGRIPPELGSLTELVGLNLSHNFLSGSIPPQLGGLKNLRWLDLGYNIPSLCVPPELPDMWRQSGERSKESVRPCEPEKVDNP